MPADTFSAAVSLTPSDNTDLVSLLSQPQINMGDFVDRAAVDRLEARNTELEAQIRALAQTVAALRPEPAAADAAAHAAANAPDLHGPDPASMQQFMKNYFGSDSSVTKDMRVSATAKKHINPPPGCTAAMLFELLSGAFEERADAKFFRGLSSFLQETVHSEKSDVAYFKYMLTSHSVLNHLVELPNEFWFNCLRMAVSPAAQKYLQERLDATFDADDQTTRPDKNLDKFAVQFKAYLPTLTTALSPTPWLARREKLLPKLTAAPSAATGLSSTTVTLVTVLPWLIDQDILVSVARIMM
ncbi:hypothetical protein KEM56_001501 [Ascosphaera pollenicola]|nr:hypothetical protein KEM56_001501 [Ascosphaera pollenicola]